METVHTNPYTRLAHELAEQRDMITRLFADHPDVGGVCSGCPILGGRIQVDAPCSIRALAQAAAAARAHAVQ